MGIVFLIVLYLFIAYLLVNALTLLGCWIKNRFTGQNNPQLKQRMSSFFVRKNEIFTTTIAVSGPPFRQEHEAHKYDIVLVLDYSGSMSGEPEKQARAGASIFVSNCTLGVDAARIGVVAFNHSALTLGMLSPNQGTVQRNIRAIPSATGATAISEGLMAARKVLEESERRNSPDLEQIVVLLSDGGDNTDGQAILEVAQQLKDERVRIFCIGVGGANRELLERISGGGVKDEETSFYTAHVDGLVGLFEKVRETMIPATGKSARVELEINLDELRLDRGTVTDIPYSRIRPVTWQLPWLKASLEEITLRMRGGPCAIGIIAVNRWQVHTGTANRDVLRMEYLRVTPEGSHKESLSVAPVRYVYIIPSFGNPWVWALLVSPWFWRLGRRLLCKTQIRKARENTLLIPASPVPDIGMLPSLAVEQTQHWHPTLSIGLGGGGISTALRLRAFISDASGGILPEAELMEIFIDTDRYHDAPPVFGAEIMPDNDFFCIGADLWPRNQELQQSEPDQFDWYNREQCHDLDRELFITDRGASRVRQLGRLSLHHMLESNTETAQRLRRKLDSAVKWLHLQKQKGKIPKVFIFCTLSGGTGGAIVQDIAHLLMQSLQKKPEMASQEIDLIIPDIVRPGGIVDHHSDRVFAGNRAAFLLELERVKSTIRYSDHPSHPGAERLGTNRFTDHDYIVNGDRNSNQAPFDSGALLALCKASANGEFTEAHAQKVTAKIRDLQPPGAMPSLIQVSVIGICPPVTLIEEYSDSEFVLELLKRRLGIALEETHEKESGLFNLIATPWEYREDALHQLFLGNPQSFHHDDSDLIFQTPLLFPDLYGLSTIGADLIGQQHLVKNILSQLNSQLDDQSIVCEAQFGACRILEWLHRIMNRRDVASLAIARDLLHHADTHLANAYEVMRTQDISTYKDELLLLCTSDALDALFRIVAQYREIIAHIDRSLSSWGFALAEGYPRDWKPKPETQKNRFVGTARRFARRQEIQREGMTDYPKVDKLWDTYAEKYYNHRINEETKRRDALFECVSWELEQSCIDQLSDGGASPLLILSANPFVLSVQRKEGGSILCDKFKAPGKRQSEMESSMLGLAAEMRPWLRKEQIQEIMLKVSSPEPYVGVRERHTPSFEAAESVFPKGGVRVRMQMAFGDSFRLSQFYENELVHDENAWKRGDRNHVFISDAYSALLQKAVALKVEPNSMHWPQNPQVVYLLQDLHRLQRFLYLFLAGGLNIRPWPDGAGREALAYHDDRPYYLASSQTGTPSAIDAAVQFVLEGNCIHDNARIVVDRMWRPSAKDIDRLNDHVAFGVSDPFLKDFDLVLKMMLYHGGYISGLERISSHLRRTIGAQ